MAKPLMPYGSKQLSGLMTKPGAGKMLMERSSAQLAANALTSSRGYLARGGWGKLSGIEGDASRLVRLNSRKAGPNS